MKASTSALALLAAFLALPGPISKLEAAEAPPGPDRKVRLAVAGFSSRAELPSNQAQSALLVDLLTSQLGASPEFALVERAQIDLLFKEAALSLGQMNRPADAIHTGKLLNADWLLFGSFLSLEGTNSVVAKIVDGQTGVIRDLTCVPFEATNALAVAEEIARFAIASRRVVPTLDQRLFLGVGTFEDLSVKSRHSDFPGGLRAMLAKRYQGTRVAVVERSMVNPLLEELRMNLGGLSVGGARGLQAQAAFLLVDGLYQSYQDTQARVNLVLRIQRIGGHTATVSIKELPGVALHEKVLAAIDRALAEVNESVPEVRQAEGAAQLERGKQLSRISTDPGRIWYLGGHPPFREFQETRLKNISEGINAFEAALLLDPQNIDARYFLAVCFNDPLIGKANQARDLFREVIASSTNAAMVKKSRRAVAASYRGVDNAAALELYLALKKDAVDPREESSFMDVMSDLYQTLYASNQVARTERLAFEEARWRCSCRAAEWTADHGERLPFYGIIDPALYALGSIFKKDQEGMRKYLEEIVPRLESEFPRLAPYLVSGHMRWAGTNASSNVVERYQKLLSWYETNAAKVLCPGCFSSDSLFRDLRTFMADRQYDMAGDVSSRLDRYGRDHLRRSDRDEMDIFLGYLWRERGQWREAMAAFQRVEDREVRLTFAGLWGQGGIVSAKRAADECRRVLEPGRATGPRIVSAGEPLARLSHTIYFISDGPRLWLASGTEMYEFSKIDSRTRPIPLSCTNRAPIGRIAVTTDKVWLGTANNGLLAYDKSTGQCRHYGEEEGLLLDRITALCVAPDRLWIGFGGPDSNTPLGGIGYLDLKTDKFVGLVSEFSTNLSTAPVTGARSSSLDLLTGPPRRPVTDLSLVPSDSLWVAVLGKGVQRYSVKDGKWTTPFEGCFPRCVAGNERYVIVGCYEPGGGSSKTVRFGGLVIHDRSKGDWRNIGVGDGLPSNEIKTLALAGDQVWVGGRGFLALVGLATGSIEEVVEVKESRVQNIQIDSNAVWFSADRSLYRLVRN